MLLYVTVFLLLFLDAGSTTCLHLKKFSVVEFLITDKVKDSIKVIDQFLQEKCRMDVSNDTFIEVELELPQVAHCIQTTYPLPRTISGFYNSICFDLPGVFHNCLRRLVFKLDACFYREEEKYLDNFIFGSFNSTVENFCRDNNKMLREHIHGVVKARSWEQCKWYSAEGVNHVIDNFCIPRFGSQESIQKGPQVSRSYVCRNIRMAVECFVEGLTKQCEDDLLAKFVATFSEPYLNWCLKNSSAQTVISRFCAFVCMSNLLFLYFSLILRFTN